MKPKRILFIVMGCAAFAAWFSAAMTPLRYQPPLGRIASPPPVDPDSVALASEVARLRARLRPEVTPRQHARNLFAFDGQSSRSVATPAAGPAAAAVSPAGQPASVDTLKLVGLMEDTVAPDGRNGGIVRTAIVSVGGQLLFVKEGGVVVEGDVAYTVGPIAEGGVDLTDRLSGRVRHLVMK